MPHNESIFAFPPTPPAVKSVSALPPAADGKRKEPAIELDMGEASREQGFRLYGCR